MKIQNKNNTKRTLTLVRKSKYTLTHREKNNLNQNTQEGTFPDGPVVKNLPANAGDRFDPWSGKIPHAAEQLSLWPTATEADLPRARAPQEKPSQQEAQAPQLERNPHWLQLQKAHAQHQRPSEVVNK